MALCMNSGGEGFPFLSQWFRFILLNDLVVFLGVLVEADKHQAVNDDSPCGMLEETSALAG